MRTMAVLLVAGLLLVGGCGDDDNSGGTPSPTPGGKQTWEQFVRSNSNGAKPAAAFEGHKVWVSEADRTVYIEDCAAAQRSTKPAGPFPGYGYACDTER